MQKQHSPPRWANRFLEWYCNPDLLEEIQGDAYELYDRTLESKGKRRADFQFGYNVLRFCRWTNIKRTRHSYPSPSFMMYQNYFTVFKRGFLKQKGYSFLNVFGLAIGIACFLLISFYIRDEYSYDKMHTKADRIFRVHEIFEADGVGERSASLPFAVAEALQNDHSSQIEKYVRFFNLQAPVLALSTTDNSKEFNEARLFFTDSTFFDVFDFNLVQGDKQSALQKTNSIVLTESMARKYFGDVNPVGKFLRFQGSIDLLVTGVLKDVPLNTHFQFDFLVSFLTLNEVYEGKVPVTNWHWNPCWTYILVKDKETASALEAAMPAFVKKYFPPDFGNNISLRLFPLTDIHLQSNMDYEIHPNSNLTTIYIFASIALFVLLIACINFINLSTARAIKRAKEVGMRKTLGGQRKQLIAQFLFESMMLCALSVLIALALILLVLPVFNVFAEKNIPYTVLLQPYYLMLITLIPMAVGLIAGTYPAFVLSSFKPITALKSGAGQESGVMFRKLLVITQFSLSIILLIGTGVAMDQLNMLQTSDNGFTSENVILIPVTRSPVAKNYESLKNEFLRNSNVIGVTAMEEILGAKHQVGSYLFEGFTESRPIPRLSMRHDFIKTFGIPLVAGRDYSEEVMTDDSLALVVNEQFVKQMGWASNEEAIGKTFDRKSNRKIIGVVKDFNIASRHQPIRPIVLDLNTEQRGFNLRIKYMAVRISNTNRSETISFLQQQWKSLIPGWPFEYFFLDSSLNDLYKAENKMSKITLVFSTLSIFVACLGLFGLSTYTAEQRKKEMSIRKVLGSTGSQIFVLFSERFFNLILISNLVAFPLAYLLMKFWLSSFAYQVKINPLLFLLSGLGALTIAFITICYQAIRTTRTNPVEALKAE